MLRRRIGTVLVMVCAFCTTLPLAAPPALAFTEGADNNFFGTGAGASTTGTGNSFFGGSAGAANTSGLSNSFFGRNAGLANTGGLFNSFFGASAGDSNTTGGENAFFGVLAGGGNTIGFGNAFFGRDAGISNSTGDFNAFFGRGAGRANTTAEGNAFFGAAAGLSNTTGADNAFYGRDAGQANTVGINNAIFGSAAGFSNTGGSANSMFGDQAAQLNTTGSENVFFGWNAGISNSTEHSNSFIGARSNGSPGITNATALGSRAQVTQSNSLVLGSINGLNFANANTKVGIGTASPAEALHVRRQDGSAKLFVQEALSSPGVRTQLELHNAGGPRFLFANTALGGVTWQFSELSNNNFTISDVGDGGAEYILQPDGVMRVGDAGVFKLVLDTAGNLSIGGTLTESSDRNKKTDISPADTAKLLDAIDQLAISSWRYKGDDQLHLGPMAQDFHRLFGVGTDTTISPRDVASVALLAARELERTVKLQQRQIQALRTAVAER